MKNLICIVLGAGMLCSCAGHGEQPESLTKYVDPRIGSDGHGHVFVGANVPFGFVQAGPSEHCRGWDWCSGYHYSDSVLIGFGQMHLSGTGVGDLGDIALLPAVDAGTREVVFSHDDEIARPGYYSLAMPGGIQAELTATQRVGVHRYTFPDDADTCYVVLDLNQGVGWDHGDSCYWDKTADNELAGLRHSRGWAKNQYAYFDLQASQPFSVAGERADSVVVLSFANTGQPLMLKVGLSAVSETNARANMAAEAPGWDFDAIAAEADQAWEKELGKIRIATSDEAAKRVFYTALYHTMVAPSVFCDVNGEYRGADGQTHSGDFTNYTTLSLWDVYRSAFPLYTLTQPERMPDFAKTMITICEQQGKLPVWHLMGCETNCMVGNPAIPILADIALKGFEIDTIAAFAAAKQSAMKPERGLDLLAQHGYIPYDAADDNHDGRGSETVGRGMEYAIADAATAKLARLAGQEADWQYFYDRSKSYRKYYDPATGFMRAVLTDGTFRKPFNPRHTAPLNHDYTEGNAWQYTWLVPHDAQGLIELMGGNEKFVTKLDSVFALDSYMGEETPPDVSGMIGQYAHGNEPSHHVAYLYNAAGQPWRAQELVRQIMRDLYTDAPDGLCGNEDVGQMSAWYVLSALGLYQVDPAGGPFELGSPAVDKAVLDLGGGNALTITAHNNSPENVYVEKVLLDGKPVEGTSIPYAALRSARALDFYMSPSHKR